MTRKGRLVYGFGFQPAAETRLLAAIFNVRCLRIGRLFAVALV